MKAHEGTEGVNLFAFFPSSPHRVSKYRNTEKMTLAKDIYGLKLTRTKKSSHYITDKHINMPL